MAKKIAYLGPEGTYSEEACELYAPGADLVPLLTLLDVVAAVEDGRVDEAVVPIENSLAGTITDIADALINAETARIIAEIMLPIEICLITTPGASRDGITVVRSKAEALDQCRQFLAERLPGVRQEATDSTAGAVSALSAAEPGAAALGPRRAAEITGMEILEAGVEDRKNNVTRFVSLSARKVPRTGKDKTSIVFDFDEEDSPGLVYAALKPFADKGINLTKIESRPTGSSLGSYYFLLDFDGHTDDDDVKSAVGSLRRHTAMFKVLGSYPRVQAPGR